VYQAYHQDENNYICLKLIPNIKYKDGTREAKEYHFMRIAYKNGNHNITEVLDAFFIES